MTPLLLKVNDVARLLSCGKTKLYSMHASGEFGPTFVRLRGAVRVRTDELEAWVKAGCPARVKWVEVWRP